MMVFSMYVAGHPTADSNEFGSGRHRQKPAFGNDDVQDLIERKTTLTFENAVFRIERKDLVEFKGRNGPLRKRRVAVATAIAARYESSFFCDQPAQLVREREAGLVALHYRVVAPVGDLFFHRLKIV